jgi:universal stress protein A
LGAARVETRLLQGFAAGEIVAYAKDTHSDLIVMGTHGRSGPKHLLLGSVAERVVRTAACPVLTVRARTTEIR